MLFLLFACYFALAAFLFVVGLVYVLIWAQWVVSWSLELTFFSWLMAHFHQTFHHRYHHWLFQSHHHHYHLVFLNMMLLVVVIYLVKNILWSLIFLPQLVLSECHLLEIETHRGTPRRIKIYNWIPLIALKNIKKGLLVNIPSCKLARLVSKSHFYVRAKLQLLDRGSHQVVYDRSGKKW